MVREKTVIRFVLGSLSILALVVLSAAADTLPNLAKALVAQQELVADRPYDAEIHNDYGNLLVLAGRSQEAGEAYRRAIELAPDATLARYNLGVLLQQSGRWKRALAEFQGLLEIDAHHARAHYQLGMLFHLRNQRSKAVEHYAQAFAYDPELTFPSINPHLIDNELATEAILSSRRYDEAPSSDMPRLYGEPERIADLMLSETSSEASSKTRKSKPVSRAGNQVGKGERAGAIAFEDEEENGEEEDDDEEDDDEEDGDEEDGKYQMGSRAESDPENGRRALTSEDLDTGSAIGRVREPARSRSSTNRSGRSSQGRDGRSAVRSGSREDSGRRQVTGGTLGNDGRSAPRYRPSSRFSTGRLELKLLPAESSARHGAATATR